MKEIRTKSLQWFYAVACFCSLLLCASCAEEEATGNEGDGTDANDIKIELYKVIDGQMDESPVRSMNLAYQESVVFRARITKGDVPYTGYKSVIWGTSFPDALEITSSEDNLECQVKAISNGRESNVGVMVDTGNGVKSNVCLVNIPVVPAEKIEIAPTEGIKVDENGNKSLKLAFGGEKVYQLKIGVEPAYSADTKVEWQSSHTDIATIDENGYITTYNKAGKTTITATHLPATPSRASRSGEENVLMSLTLEVVPTIDQDLVDGEHDDFDDSNVTWEPGSTESL